MNAGAVLRSVVLMFLLAVVMMLALAYLSPHTMPQPGGSPTATTDNRFADQMRQVCAALAEKAAADAAAGNAWVRTPFYDSRTGVCDAGLQF